MKKRTLVDFSKHELTIDSNNICTIHWLKKPDTTNGQIKFINIDGVLVVKGDYGNWIFCREFIPSAVQGAIVSDSYWIEKLETLSTQKGREFDTEGTIEVLSNGIGIGLENDGYEGEQLKSLKEYYKVWQSFAEDSNSIDEYIRMASSDMPDFIDIRDIPYHTRTKNWLEVVFDAYEEINLRLKEKVS